VGDSDARKKLEAVAIKRIREDANTILPRVYTRLLEALEEREENRPDRLYNREKVLSIVREEPKKVA